jgi:pimeloyl-ACP methyl ester carboxylesterase
MRFKYILILLFILAISSCRIDELVLDVDDNPAEYNFTNANADIDSAYFIDESLVNVFSLESDNEGDVSEIWALYLGDMDSIASDTVLLYCHGNDPSMDGFWDYHIMQLAHVGGKHRFGVMALDYRGFGNSKGEFNTENFVADMNAVISWLKDKGLDEDRLIIIGNSLGAMPAVHACTRSNTLQTSKLVLDAPFPGITPILEGATGLSLDGTTMSDFGDADNAEEIKSYTGDLLWFHCKDDETVPFEHAETIYDNHPGEKRSVITETGGHAPIEALGTEEFLDEILTFILD